MCMCTCGLQRAQQPQRRRVVDVMHGGDRGEHRVLTVGAVGDVREHRVAHRAPDLVLEQHRLRRAGRRRARWRRRVEHRAQPRLLGGGGGLGRGGARHRAVLRPRRALAHGELADPAPALVAVLLVGGEWPCRGLLHSCAPSSKWGGAAVCVWSCSLAAVEARVRQVEHPGVVLLDKDALVVVVAVAAATAVAAGTAAVAVATGTAAAAAAGTATAVAATGRVGRGLLLRRGLCRRACGRLLRRSPCRKPLG
eukprot:scaffold22473_cov60-Phaeocystis_antarctica.AAC.2